MKDYICRLPGVVQLSNVAYRNLSSYFWAGQVKTPQRDMPLGIGAALAICAILYMLVSAVIVGLVPYYDLDPDTPVSSVFANYGMNWAVYIITTGAVTALCASLIGAIIPQVLSGFSLDGLLPSFFSDISRHTQVPLKSTLATGIFIAVLAFFMDVSQLAGMVSVGTLLAFTTVAISVLVVRYVPPPDELSYPSLLQQSVTAESSLLRHRNTLGIGDESTNSKRSTYTNSEHPHCVAGCPLLQKEVAQDTCDEFRRQKSASWAITLVCVGILMLVSAASAQGLSSIPRFAVCGVGGIIVLCCSTVLGCLDQASKRVSFKKSGGFLCPFVPFLPITSILVNTYLLLNIGAATWMFVLLWLAAGVLIYALYGRTHSCLQMHITSPDITRLS